LVVAVEAEAGATWWVVGWLMAEGNERNGSDLACWSVLYSIAKP
jgi:hypothetical protein